jgi:LmbE family N-acetylglucosaminyl deacetylase
VNEVSNLTLMAVFAHPDDEAFGTGGTLTKYAAEGCDVYLVTATRGEAGQIAEPDMATTANLPYVREQELRCACRLYGIHAPRFLDYQDGQLAIVNQGQAVGRLVRIIRELKPQVIITFGPDGIYGHYDHIAVHRWTTIAVDLAADPDCFPEQDVDSCPTHQVSKVYYRVLPHSLVEAMAEEEGKRPSVMMDGVPFYFSSLSDADMTTVIDVSDFVKIKMQGIQCHATQVGRDNSFTQDPEKTMRDPSFRSEHFVLAHSTLDRPQSVETDLFSGLR